MARRQASTARPAADFGARRAMADPNAQASERATQTAFAANRTGGVYIVGKADQADIQLAGQVTTVVVDNASTAANDRPMVRFPKVSDADQGKMLLVTSGSGSLDFAYKTGGPDKVNNASHTTTSRGHTAASNVIFDVFIVISASIGWRTVIWGT